MCRAEALAAAAESSDSVQQNKDEADSGIVSTVTQVGGHIRMCEHAYTDYQHCNDDLGFNTTLLDILLTCTV